MSSQRPTTTPSARPTQGGAVLIPVKDFSRAKSRLGSALDPDERAHLARAMATHVVQVQGGLPVFICCDEPSVADWAAEVGATAVWCPGTDLNGAITAGIAHLQTNGFTSVAIAHGDLPHATDLAPLLHWPGVTIVPDRHRTGTNVMSLPVNLDFTFSYGAGSFERHVREAVRLQHGLRIVHHAGLGWDIDHPDDLDGANGGVRGLLERTRP